MKRPSGAAERHERGCIAVNVKMELRVIPPRHPLRPSSRYRIDRCRRP